MQEHQSYMLLPSSFYKVVPLNPVKNPSFLVVNEQLAEELGIDVSILKSERALQIFAGNEMPESAAQIAQSYAGHQFGQFTMLGDGRAILIGEEGTKLGLRDFQLKGSGRTPYSRGGDGRAAVGPMLREYIISEALHGLHIPTTRSLAVVKTGEPVYRERVLDGAILTRVASSHLRVGTFQFARHFCDHEDLQALADYAIQRHDSILASHDNPYADFFSNVLHRQAKLIASWQQIGFIHGVMNTDNMTISGEAIDFGPCAFMDTFDPATVFSSIDTTGRYAYENQPKIGSWNLARLAETLLPLVHEDEEQALTIMQEKLDEYPKVFQHYWLEGMRKKLGLQVAMEEDASLIDELLTMMYQQQADFTNTFRSLSTDEAQDIFETEDFKTWQKKWYLRLQKENTSLEMARYSMRNINPAIIARNHYVEEALKFADQGDLSYVETLVDALRSPFTVKKEHQHLQNPPKENGPFITYCGT
ncbi:YdiU family protein [Rummeliibacillus sp. POC4]|uniref:protein adenylyltransferase SelO n=1 Tax=Rummeliibacillus sp. POC4 TaxID=2305899 RepID=UPI000E67355E|nr:YdiU family protein [Rummeliibacillus sp. POC4]RIJ65633.1 YdiU family protein [Rummeliibacillus sp. POC4]